MGLSQFFSLCSTDTECLHGNMHHIKMRNLQLGVHVSIKNLYTQVPYISIYAL